MKIIAKKGMKWRGYGFQLKPGENVIEGKIPFGLLRSLERHAKHNHIQIVEPYVDPDPPKPKRQPKPKKATKEDSNENPETPAVQSPGDSAGEGAGSPAPETDAQETTDQDQLDLFFDGAEPGEGDGGSAPAADASAVVSVETQVSEQPTQPQKKRGKRNK